MAPLATKSPLPYALRIRGNRRPRKKSSSTHGARSATSADTANQAQLPWKKCSARLVSMNLGKSLGIGPVGSMGSALMATESRVNGSTHHHAFPPTRPLLG
jgi:hypothetical protein